MWAPVASTSGETSGATTVTSAPAASSPCTLRAAIGPPPTTRQRRPVSASITGYCGPSTGIGRLLAVRPLPVEAEDLQLDGQVDLSQRDTGWHRHRRRCEVEDRPDPRVDQAIDDLLGRRGGRGDHADGPADVVHDLGQFV